MDVINDTGSKSGHVGVNRSIFIESLARVFVNTSDVNKGDAIAIMPMVDHRSRTVIGTTNSQLVAIPNEVNIRDKHTRTIIRTKLANPNHFRRLLKNVRKMVDWTQILMPQLK